MATWEPLTSGKHVWTVHVRAACDLVWLGVSDGALEPGVWVSAGGRVEGWKGGRECGWKGGRVGVWVSG